MDAIDLLKEITHELDEVLESFRPDATLASGPVIDRLDDIHQRLQVFIDGHDEAEMRDEKETNGDDGPAYEQQQPEDYLAQEGAQ